MTMANQCIQYTEEMVGQAHPTKSDTLNRLVVGVNNFRLIKSGATLTLEAVNGNLVDINGSVYAVTTLPTLAATALSENTTYYIYLYNNSGTATLEASTTGYTVDTKGRANKTGDATRRLMGMARVIAGPAWADTAAQRFVISRDNRRHISAVNVFAADRQTNSGSLVELSNTERTEFLAWAGSAVRISSAGSCYNGSAALVTTKIGIDDTTPEEAESPISLAASGFGPINMSFNVALTDGYHYATLLGMTSAGTATWAGSGTAGSRCALHVLLMG